MGTFNHPRLPNWQQLLTDFLNGALATPNYWVLDWADYTCAEFCADTVIEMTGHDPMPEFRNKFNSAYTAAKAIKELGYRDLEHIAQTKFEEVPVVMAQRGDLLLAPARSMSDDKLDQIMPVAFALADPPFFYCVNPEGLCRGNILEAVKAFRIG